MLYLASGSVHELSGTKIEGRKLSFLLSDACHPISIIAKPEDLNGVALEHLYSGKSRSFRKC